MMNFAQILSQFQQAQNPMNLMLQLCNSNPEMRKVAQNLQGKTPQELEKYARNMAQSRGTNLQQFLAQFGLKI